MTIDTTKLIGNTMYLEVLTPEHFPALLTAARDERIWEFTKEFDIHRDDFENSFQSYLTTALDPSAMDQQQTFVIRSLKDQEIIGMTRLYEISEKDKRVSIGHTWYIPAVWTKLYNKECKFLLLQYVFETLQFNRVGFAVAHQNIRSQKAVEKIGGVKEGVIRKYGYRNDGSLRDRVMYSILDEEWPAKKENLQRLITDYKNR